MLFAAIPNKKIHVFKKILHSLPEMAIGGSQKSYRLGIDSTLYIFDTEKMVAIARSQKDMLIYDFHLCERDGIENIIILYCDRSEFNMLTFAMYESGSEIMKCRKIIAPIKHFISSCISKRKIYFLTESTGNVNSIYYIDFNTLGETNCCELNATVMKCEKTSVRENLTSIGYILSDIGEFIVIGTSLSGRLILLKHYLHALIQIQYINLPILTTIERLHTFCSDKLVITTGKHKFIMLQINRLVKRLVEYTGLDGALSVQSNEQWIVLSHFIGKGLSTCEPQKIIFINVMENQYGIFSNKHSLINCGINLSITCHKKNFRFMKIHDECKIKHCRILLGSELETELTKKMRDMNLIESSFTDFHLTR